MTVFKRRINAQIGTPHEVDFDSHQGGMTSDGRQTDKTTEGSHSAVQANAYKASATNTDMMGKTVKAATTISGLWKTKTMD